MSDQYWHLGGLSGLIVRAAIRTLQFVFAIIVAALYGVDLQRSTENHTSANSAWVYAEVVACLSILTCIVHCFVTVKRVAWCAWDWVVFILWASQFGVFGTIYIGGKDSTDEDFTKSVLRMKVAVWIDLVNMLLWFATAVGGIVWCCTARRVTRRTDKMEMGEEAGHAFVNQRPSLRNEFDAKAAEKELEVCTRMSTERTLNGQDDESTNSKLGNRNGQ